MVTQDLGSVDGTVLVILTGTLLEDCGHYRPSGYTAPTNPTTVTVGLGTTLETLPDPILTLGPGNGLVGGASVPRKVSDLQLRLTGPDRTVVMTSTGRGDLRTRMTPS